MSGAISGVARGALWPFPLLSSVFLREVFLACGRLGSFGPRSGESRTTETTCRIGLGLRKEAMVRRDGIRAMASRSSRADVLQDGRSERWASDRNSDRGAVE